MSSLKFERLSSAVDVSFWFQLRTHKLDKARLQVESTPIHAYSYFAAHPNTPPLLQVDMHAFEREAIVPPHHWHCPGELINLNSAEEFQAINPKEILQQCGQKIWNSVVSRRAIEDPSLLRRFVLVTFADLRYHRFQYWFGFPSVFPKLSYTVVNKIKLQDFLQLEQTQALYASLSTLSDNHSVFGISASFEAFPLTQLINHNINDEFQFGYFDAGSHYDAPSWHLRNLLVTIASVYGALRFRVFCLRSRTQTHSSASSSMIMSIVLDKDCRVPQPIDTPCTVLGWEFDTHGEARPRLVDLTSVMDPKSLAQSSVDLNVRLMRWRQVPSLNVDVIAHSKCLLFGVGTLGCCVARTLMGWGVRTMSFVDNGRVHYSNPVRQSLFEFEDSIDGGRYKAIAAAERCQKIAPSINANGYVLSIPMPGHPVCTNTTDDTLDNTRKNFYTICELVNDHDVIFTLTDSRESRWLPTLLAKHANKFLINVALGFDTFVTMRQGTRDNELGCYFCTDITAPANSLTHRPLDQQCTVSRPGLAPMASGIAVELMMAVLHHPQRQSAEASSSLPVFKRPPHTLGIIPHQLRGWLSHFDLKILSSAAFRQCVACSPAIVEEFNSRGFDFINDVLNDSNVLETVSGLASMKQKDEYTWDNDSSDSS